MVILNFFRLNFINSKFFLFSTLKTLQDKNIKNMRTNILLYSSTTILNPLTYQNLKSMLGSNYDIIQINSNNLLKEPWFDTTSCLIFLSSKNLLFNIQFKKKF